MSIEEIKNIINQYFDNELSKNEEIVLFTKLSQDDDAREYFKEMNFLRTATESLVEDYPDNLDVKILSQINKEEPNVLSTINRSKIFTAVSYGFAAVLLAISIFFYNESIDYKERIELTYEHVNQQNRMINILLNGLPQAEVRAEFANEIIVTPKM